MLFHNIIKHLKQKNSFPVELYQRLGRMDIGDILVTFLEILMLMVEKVSCAQIRE